MNIREFLLRGYCVLNVVPGCEGKKEGNKEGNQPFFDCYYVRAPLTSVTSFNLHNNIWGKYLVLLFEETERGYVTCFGSLTWQMAEPEFSAQV